ncbi:S8 family peptidase [Fictibacillus phosphorivorans]|uniref:S8 family peptidase n=1 Tax=Fictibacillus phosphorivorans TaxID=1221500 RepID=UPI00203EF1E5|nr:S8 family peptidase [Fictibacillus phosphorivorans]MCM3717624.1 S8 family peptidase [Fictibacillus phosphorivorans]MCM3775524.1 S8 family peptidase [Fictibacillus phosphorivorans]
MLKRFVAGAASLPLLVSLALPASAVESEVQEASFTTSVKQEAATQEVIVRYKDSISAFSAQNTISTFGKVVDATEDFSVVKVNGDVSEAIKKLESLDSVEYAEPNITLHASYVPNDPDYQTKQYAPQKVSAEQAWDTTQSSSNVKIAVIDTGVDYYHPDLAGKVIKGADFVDDDNDPIDENEHGTHVAGIAAANTNNGIGIAGLAPKAQILAVRVLDANGSGSLDDVAQGIRYAADQGAQVINLSLGGSVGTQTLQDAVNYAWDKGSVVVAAAGNSGVSLPSYPAYYENAIAVAATDRNDQKASFSNFGTWVDIAAPGVDIYSTIPNNQYASFSGTSMASPVVAGVAGLLAAQGKNASQIRAALENTADPVTGTGTLFQNGRVNAAKAVQ